MGEGQEREEKKMTILVTLETGITMTVEDVESYSISKDGLLVKKKGFAPKRMFPGNTSLMVERIK